MKTTLVLCAVLALTGCPKHTPVVVTGDSPIIVSDSSPTTHVRHKGAGADFQMSNNGTSIVATVADGLKVGDLDCVKGFSCSPIALKQGWTLTAFDGHNGGGSMIFTMTSTDNATIVTTFNAGIPDVDSKIDSSGDTNNGTDLVQSAHQFESVVLNNNSTTATLDCATSPCKIKIHYK